LGHVLAELEPEVEHAPVLGETQGRETLCLADAR
jgi:hypothetical protein